DREQHEGVHVGGPGHPGRPEADPLGRSRGAASARIPDVRSVRHARDDHPRLAHPSQRVGPRGWRSDVLPARRSGARGDYPAAPIVSCAADLAKWMTVQLNGGAMEGGRRLFSAEQSKTMWSGVTIMPIAEPAKDADPAFAATQPNFNMYGLGWALRDYRGKRV